MKNQKFYICRTCGNLVGMIHSSGVPLICCGKPMEELQANTVEASNEKHLPVVKIDDKTVTVKVGAAAHPMVEEHFIEWIYLETDQGGQRKTLSPGQEPAVNFALDDEKVKAVYAYCNLHGLWKVEIE